MAALRPRLRKKASAIDQAVGRLTADWARRTGLPSGIPVATGAFDAHLGGVGSGIGPGTLVKIIGTSTCDMMVSPLTDRLPDIPGLCGIVPESVLPGHYGLEAGQSAVGDIFNWFVNYIQPLGKKAGSHEALSAAAAKIAPGESGLLALDWNNGNRTILVDQQLTNLLIKQTLYTTPTEIYRALIKTTTFNTLTIINRFEEYNIKIAQIMNYKNIAEKNPLVMQIYTNITKKPIKISQSTQTYTLKTTIANAIITEKAANKYDNYADAQRAM